MPRTLVSLENLAQLHLLQPQDRDVKVEVLKSMQDVTHGVLGTLNLRAMTRTLVGDQCLDESFSTVLMRDTEEVVFRALAAHLRETGRFPTSGAEWSNQLEVLLADDDMKVVYAGTEMRRSLFALVGKTLAEMPKLAFGS